MQSCAVARHDRRDGSVCAVAESTTSCAATSARVSTEKRATDSTWSRMADRSTSEVHAAVLTARTSVRRYGHRVRRARTSANPSGHSEARTPCAPREAGRPDRATRVRRRDSDSRSERRHPAWLTRRARRRDATARRGRRGLVVECLSSVSAQVGDWGAVGDRRQWATDMDADVMRPGRVWRRHRRRGPGRLPAVVRSLIRGSRRAWGRFRAAPAKRGGAGPRLERTQAPRRARLLRGEDEFVGCRMARENRRVEGGGASTVSSW